MGIGADRPGVDTRHQTPQPSNARQLRDPRPTQRL